MTEQTIPAYDDEISLLDILVTLAESWRLLVFGPIIAGVLAGGLSFLWPKTFESVAIVRMNEEEVALLHTGNVLDPLIEKFGLLAKADGVTEDAREGLKKRLVFTVDKKNKLTTITSKASAPEAAQALGRAAIDALVKELQIKGQEKVLLEKTIAINNKAITSAEDAINSIQLGLKREVASGQVLESATKNLAFIISDVATRSLENLEIHRKLSPKGAEEIYVQEPNLPVRLASPKRSLVVLVAILTSGFALLLWVFVQKVLRQAAKEFESAEKLARIKVALGVGSAESGVK